MDYESIRSEQDAAGTVHVLWAEPLHPNGAILYYVLRYRRAEQGSPFKTALIDSSFTENNKSKVNE